MMLLEVVSTGTYCRLRLGVAPVFWIAVLGDYHLNGRIRQSPIAEYGKFGARKKSNQLLKFNKIYLAQNRQYQ
jgi:hypothetical protein